MSQYIGAVPESAKQEVITVNQPLRKNYLINSNFGINQREYVNGTALTYDKYCVDRWVNVNGAASESFSFTDGVCTIGSTNDPLLGQRVEAVEGITAGDIMTLSWDGTAVATVAGVVSGVSSPYSFRVLQSDITAGRLAFIYFSGNGGTVVEPKLELGTSATPYEHPDVPTELARCLRYFERLDIIESAQSVATGYCQNSTQGRFTIPYHRKASAPSITMSALSSFSVSSSGVDATVTSIVNVNEGLESARLLAGVASGLTTGRGALLTATAGAYMDIDAEL